MKPLLLSLPKQILAILVCLAALSGFAFAEPDQRVNKDENNLAISGFDTVAYFTTGEPTEGNPEYTHLWQDSKWRFSSAKHRDLFAGDPEKYAPRYGGYCAMAMAQGKVYKANPKEWKIIDGKLYLNYSRVYSDQFNDDPGSAIAQADANWVHLGKLE